MITNIIMLYLPSTLPGKFTATVFFLMISLASFSQVKQDTTFADLDLYTLRGIYPLQQPTADSSLKNIRCSYNNHGQVNEIHFRKSFYSWQETRSAKVFRNKESTILAFKVNKEAGFEKVIFFGEVIRYYDTILILRDTIYFKEVSGNYVNTKIIFPEKNDTLVIKSFGKPVNTPAARGHDFHTLLSFHSLWENHTNWNYSDTYTFVSRNSHYELVSLITSGKPGTDAYYLNLQENIKKAGHSITWLLLSNFMEW